MRGASGRRAEPVAGLVDVFADVFGRLEVADEEACGDAVEEGEVRVEEQLVADVPAFGWVVVFVDCLVCLHGGLEGNRL